ncbi:MAG: CBS domain-containing protein [Gorillibacterium sp.]|nr:CBS domain-containing protein [Gorillibacterium sp.]
MQKVKEIMTKDIVTLNQHDTIFDAAVLMKEKNIGFVPVLDESHVVGTLTDRDLVIRGYALKHPGSTPISELMSTTVIAVRPETSLDEAAEKMANEQIRRLLVIEEGHLMGVVALGDLAIRQTLEEQAGAALSEISEPEHSPYPLQ